MASRPELRGSSARIKTSEFFTLYYFNSYRMQHYINIDIYNDVFIRKTLFHFRA